MKAQKIHFRAISVIESVPVIQTMEQLQTLILEGWFGYVNHQNRLPMPIDLADEFSYHLGLDVTLCPNIEITTR